MTMQMKSRQPTRRSRLFVGRHVQVLILFATIAAICGGCSDGRSSVSGSVTLDGQPLTKTDNRTVTIMFTPEAGGAPASALVDESGSFTLHTGAKAGLDPGKYVVTLAAVEVSSTGKRLVAPERYGDPTKSDLRAEVKPGSNDFEFDLTSAAGG